MSDRIDNVSIPASHPIVAAYFTKFGASLDMQIAWAEIKERCKRRHDQKLMAAVEGCHHSDIADEVKAAKLFMDFLISDDSAAELVARVHSKSLAAFDSVMSAIASEAKETGRKVLEAEYAVWQAHRQLLSAAMQNEEILEEIQESDVFAELLARQGGFQRHKLLSFSPLWKEIFPR